MSRFKFAKVKVHPKLDLTAWYIVIDDFDSLMEMHRWAARSMFLKYAGNPHLFENPGAEDFNLIARGEWEAHYHPIRLAAGWLATATKGLLEHGRIYMNQAHGLLFGTVEILETRDADEATFPKEDSSKAGVKVTISRYGDGQHFYLTAKPPRIFSREKFNSEAEAMSEARKHAIDENITASEARPYSKDGD